MSAAIDFDEKREFDRIPLMMEAAVKIRGESIPCTLLNIVAFGAKVRIVAFPSNSRAREGEDIALCIPKFGEFDGIVTWVDDEFLGIRFDENHKAISALVTASA